MINPSVRGRIWQIFFLIVILVLVASMINFGSYYNKGVDVLSGKTGGAVSLPKVKDFPFHLGLDLQGGTHLVYQADMSNIPAADQASSLEGVRDVIERRVNVFGVSEPNIQTSMSGGDYRVIVELAGVSDVQEAIQMIGETPLLEFKEQQTEARKLTDEEKKSMDEYNKNTEKNAEDVLGKLISGGDFAALAKDYSDDTATKDNGGDLGWFTEKDNPDVYKIVKDMKPGDYTKDIKKTSSGYEIVKLAEKRDKANPFDETQKEKEVKASHLLLCYKDIEGCTNNLSKEEAQAKINELKKQATAKNFSDLVKNNSTEPGANQSGGELGWFDKSMMVEAFSNAVFAQKVGAISDPVETEFGYHLIYKQAERNITEYKASHILFRTKSEADIIGNNQDWKNTQLSGKNLKRASVTFDPNDNSPQVSLEFDEEGGKLFADITGRNVGKPVAIFLDNEAISIPTVNEKIPDGKAVISGKFNIKEAKLLAQRLNAGALPVPITLINQQTIGATLGQSSVKASLVAGLVGFALVALFMVIFYRLPGFLAVISLAIYSILVLAIFKLFVTLTLAGLAGFILSIGMAVDANVLIFSRLREELDKGKPYSIALEEGFHRAWPSIRDSNFNTLITCFILINFTTSIVKGFAITLAVGVIVSMFSAISITRTLMQLIGGEWLGKHLWLVGAKNKQS